MKQISNEITNSMNCEMGSTHSTYVIHMKLWKFSVYPYLQFVVILGPDVLTSNFVVVGIIIIIIGGTKP
jgi:hypothetical protein